MKIRNTYKFDFLEQDLIKTLKIFRKKRNFKPETYLKRKIELLNSYMSKSKLKACVVGVSGGIDSAVTLGLICQASKIKHSPIKEITAALMPIMNSDGATNQKEALMKGQQIAKNFGIKAKIIDLSSVHKLSKATIDQSMNIKGNAWAAGQLASYIRTPILYYLTSLLTQNNLPAIVCGTTNKDEGSYLGYYGKASDGMVDVQLISDIHKSEVYELGNLLNIPKNITEAAPSGDMFDGKNDEEVFGAPYDFVELYLEYLSIKNKKIKTTIQKTWSAKAKNQFKQLSDNLEALHNYNKHKYLVASPAMHLDIYKYSIPEGWSSKIYA